MDNLDLEILRLYVSLDPAMKKAVNAFVFSGGLDTLQETDPMEIARTLRNSIQAQEEVTQ